MDDKVFTAIMALANKLGTTTEYLWAVLIKQAYITAFHDVVTIGALVAILTMWVRFLIRKTRTPEKTESQPYPQPEWPSDELLAAMSWIVTGFAIMIIGVIVIAGTQEILTALLNPDYWALKQIIKR